jgi:glycosyltransferase involved in cell wall biosynthesis
MAGRRQRVGLLCSEPLGERVAGVGLRYLEIARRLPPLGLDVLLVAPGEPERLATLADELGDGVSVSRFERGRLGELFGGRKAVFGQGQLVNDLLLECPDLACAVDLYDPWLIENLHYLETLGLDPWRNDHATWLLQMSRGDFFVCSCEEQRHFYLGFLLALGRLNPPLHARDPDLRSLVDVAPFGAPDPERMTPHRPWLEPRAAGERRLLFGGLYDWYDPWPVLEALEASGEPGWHLIFIRNPFADTPQGLLEQVEAWRRRSSAGARVELRDWVPYDRRLDLLRDVDVMVATHRTSLETRLSLRTRFLDALAAGCPVITSEGGAISRLLREHDAGWVVPENDPAAVLAALRQILEGGEKVAQRTQRGVQAARGLGWDEALRPVIEFLQRPRRDATKHDFLSAFGTAAPRDAVSFRVRRWLGRRVERVRRGVARGAAS